MDKNLTNKIGRVWLLGCRVAVLSIQHSCFQFSIEGFASTSTHTFSPIEWVLVLALRFNGKKKMREHVSNLLIE